MINSRFDRFFLRESAKGGWFGLYLALAGFAAILMAVLVLVTGSAYYSVDMESVRLFQRMLVIAGASWLTFSFYWLRFRGWLVFWSAFAAMLLVPMWLGLQLSSS